MRIAAEQLPALLKASPLAYGLLQRLHDGGRSGIFQACDLPQNADVVMLIFASTSDGLNAPGTRRERNLCGRLLTFPGKLALQEAEDALAATARQKGWVQDDGSVALTDVYTVITATNGEHEDKDADYTAGFRKLLEKSREWAVAPRANEGTQT